MTRRFATLLSALLFTVPVAGFGVRTAHASVPQQARQAYLFVVEPSTFEDLMSVPAFRQLTRAGGAGLMTTTTGPGLRLSAAEQTLGWGTERGQGDPASTLLAQALDLPVCETGPDGRAPARGAPTVLGADNAMGCPAPTLGPGLGLRPFLKVVHLEASGIGGRTAGNIVRGALRRSVDYRTLVLVVSPTPSFAMQRAGDEVTPLVMAAGMPDRLFPANGPLHALTSDTTRQDGLVSNVDVAPTILNFFGIAIPGEMDGEPIRVTDGPAPFALHRLHLEHRRSRVPVQVAELAFIVVSGLLAMWAVAEASRRGAMELTLARRLRFVFLVASALLLVLLAGGRLPHLTYVYVFPFVGVAIVALAALAVRFVRRDPFGPFTFIGAVGLAFLLFDSATGERAMRLPLFGGTMFDGARFYGLPNAFLPLLLASALFVARPLTPLQGFLVLVGAGLFAGFPSMGADVGGAITLFAAAGMWWVLSTRPRVRVREVALVVAVMLAGLGAVLLANRYLPGAPTHATRFVERAGNGVGSAFDTIRHRLGLGVHQVVSEPATLIPLVGLVAVLLLVLRGSGLVGEAMALDRRWRDVVLVLVLASAVAFVVNDTGASAAGPAFIYAMAGIAYPTMRVAERRIRGPDATPRTVGANT